MSSPFDPLYIGIDVGTGSVRAALVQKDGTLLSTASQEIKTWRSSTDHRIFEQSTGDIWEKICVVVRGCLGEAASNLSIPLPDLSSRVKGIGFDATCSLAVTDFDGQPIVVTQGTDLGKVGERNVILWADHRAEAEAEFINGLKRTSADAGVRESARRVLGYVGGRISLEMEIPKIVWLKNTMSHSSFTSCEFFDLPDWLTYRATGRRERSCCSLACKCCYAPGGWDDAFFRGLGLEGVVEGGYRQLGPGIGGGVRGNVKGDVKGRGNTGGDKETQGEEEEAEVLTAGVPIGTGLSPQAASELGLTPGVCVGSALIDAYAGWLGTVGARCLVPGSSQVEGQKQELELEPKPNLEEAKHRLAVVAGTSTCHIVQSQEGVFVDGIWGPYKDPIFPGWWMNEGGQSSTGQLIDHVITTHPAYRELVEKAEAEGGKNIFDVLHDTLEKLRVEKGAGSYSELTKDLHVYPDFHGNRSPIADARMKGSITGLDLSTSLSSLALLYHATLTAIALQTRQIVERLNENGHEVEVVYISGSQARNGVLMRLLVGACYGGDLESRSGSWYAGRKGSGEGLRRRVKGVVVSSSDVETDKKKGTAGVSAVVLGAAMLGRMAHEGGEEKDEEKVAARLWNIMTEMTPPGVLIAPGQDEVSVKERKIVEAKYQIFIESLEAQQKWRYLMDEACQ